MIDTTTPTTSERVTCSVPGPRNDRGRPKLLATLDPAGIWVFCGHCKCNHHLSKEQCIAFWERGESVQCRDGQRHVAGVE